MTEQVERFEVTGNPDNGKPEMVRSPNPLGGGWVRHSDHQAALTQAVRDERERVKACCCIEDFLRQVTAWEGSAEDELAEALEEAENLPDLIAAIRAQEREKCREERHKRLLGAEWPEVTMMRDAEANISPPWCWWPEDDSYDHSTHETERYVPVSRLAQRDEEWEAKVKGEKGERWFVSVTEDHRIDRSWPASCEDGETPQERLMGAGVKIVAVIPEAALRERDEELRHQRCIDALSLAIEAKKSYPEMIEYILAASKLDIGRIHDLSVLDPLTGQ